MADEVTVQIVDGSGAPKSAWTGDNDAIGYLTDYSLSEYVTPIAPGDSSGGTPQISVSGIQKKRSHRAAGEYIRLNLASGESISATVNSVLETETSGTVSFTADALINKLNAEVVAVPRSFDNEPGLSLYSNAASRTRTQGLFEYYAGLVGIPADKVFVDPDIADDESLTVGFSGNLWAYLKDLCTARGYQIYSTGQDLRVTSTGNIGLFLDNTEPDTTTLTTSRDQRAQKITLPNDNWRLVAGLDSVIWKADTVYSVAAGEVQENVIELEASVSSVYNPYAVNGMDLLNPQGQYVVTGNDGYIISPARWADLGGSISVKIGENPSQLIVTIIGGTDIDLAPYRISEGAADRPALWVEGRGILTKRDLITIYTGDSTAPTETVDLDSLFLATRNQTYERGVLAAQQYSGNTQTLSITGVPALRLMLKASTQYAPSPNLLTEDQAACGRKNGIRGWGGFQRNSLLYKSGAGIRVSLPAVPVGTDILHSIPVMSVGVPLSGSDDVFSNRAWLNAILDSVTVTAAFKLTRLSGSQNVRAVIYWYDVNGEYVSTSESATATLATNVERTVYVTATSPPFDYHYAMIGLTSRSNTPTDIVVSGAQLALGSITTVTPFVDVPETQLTSFYGYLAGSILRWGDNKYRVVQAEYTQGGYDLTLALYTTFADFDERWAGKTFADFGAAIDDDMTFDQFTTEALA